LIDRFERRVADLAGRGTLVATRLLGRLETRKVANTYSFGDCIGVGIDVADVAKDPNDFRL
jgi:hypothetical protein